MLQGEHSAITLTFIKLPFVIKIFVLSIFEWLFYTGFGAVFDSKGYPFKKIFDFTTAGDWDCVAAVEHLPALHYSVAFIFLSSGNMGFIVEL